MNFSAKVKKRDGLKCRVCNRREDLTAHHIYPKCKFPQLAEAHVNGITLCFICHRRYHHHQEIEEANSISFYHWCEEQNNITAKRLEKIRNLLISLDRFVRSHGLINMSSYVSFEHSIQNPKSVMVSRSNSIMKQLQTMSKKDQVSIPVLLVHLVQSQLQ